MQYITFYKNLNESKPKSGKEKIYFGKNVQDFTRITIKGNQANAGNKENRGRCHNIQNDCMRSTNKSYVDRSRQN